MISENDVVIEMTVMGMTCAACENHVNRTLLSTPGVIQARSSYEDNWARVKFDGSKIDVPEVLERLEQATGYSVTNTKEVNED